MVVGELAQFAPEADAKNRRVHAHHSLAYRALHRYPALLEQHVKRGAPAVVKDQELG